MAAKRKPEVTPEPEAEKPPVPAPVQESVQEPVPNPIDEANAPVAPTVADKWEEDVDDNDDAPPSAPILPEPKKGPRFSARVPATRRLFEGNDLQKLKQEIKLHLREFKLTGDVDRLITTNF